MTKEATDTTQVQRRIFKLQNWPKKEMLGYAAKDYKIETFDAEMIVYVTSEAGVNFSVMGSLPNQGISCYYSSNLEETKNPLMLYMKFTNKSNPDETMEMECVGLDKKQLTKINSEYKFLKLIYWSQ